MAVFYYFFNSSLMHTLPLHPLLPVCPTHLLFLPSDPLLLHLILCKKLLFWQS